MNHNAVPWTTIFLALLSLAFARPALACSCVADEPFEWWIENTDKIFRGTALESKPESFRPGSDIHQTLFQVHTVIKGEVSEKEVVFHDTFSSSCGSIFEAGQAYIILAGKYRGRYWTSSCDQNAVWSFGQRFEDAFRENGHAPLSQIPAGKRALASVERSFLAPFLQSPWLVSFPLFFIVFWRHVKRRRTPVPKGRVMNDAMASGVIVLVCAMAGDADLYGRNWNSYYSLRIDEGYHIQSYNEREVCLEKTTNAQTKSGTELVCNLSDDPEFGPVTGYLVRDDVILVRTTGAQEVTNEIGYTFWDIDPSVTFFFVVGKSTDAVTGPLTETEFATALLPATLADTDWEAPYPPLSAGMIIKRAMVVFADAFSLLYSMIEIAATYWIATLILGLASLIWVTRRSSST